MNNHKTKTFLFRRINRSVLILVVIISFNIVISQAVTAHEPVFSTYLGGSGDDMPRDVCTDSSGNIYITGGTSSANFPTTPGAYDRTHNGNYDVFVAKFGSTGQLIWSTYLGGPNYDRAYAIEVDTQGYVYIAGRAGPGFPTTSGAFQETFNGSSQGIYGMQNGFVAKLSSDDSSLIWASYVGASWLCRDLAIDDSGNIYLPLSYPNQGTNPPSWWFNNAYQKVPQGGTDNGVVKVSNDGSQVFWATYLGGSGDDAPTSSIRVDSNGNAHIVFHTFSTDIPTTAGVHDQTHNGGADYYIAKVTTDGSDLIFATYLGGSGDECVNTHNLALDDQGNVYVSAWTKSSNFPTTLGVFQDSHGGGTSDMAIAKFSSTGSLIASTFIGGNGLDNPDGIYVDSFGNVFLSGQTYSTNFPVTSDANQSKNAGGGDAVLVILSSDFTRLVYSTYIGGGNDDNGRSGFFDQTGKLYLAGTSSGSGWPTLNAFQDSFAGGQYDGILAKFVDLTPPSPPTGLMIVKQ